MYTVTINATNGAGLVTSAVTSPIVYDNSQPRAGHVTEGSDFKTNIVWWGFTDHIEGTIGIRKVIKCDSMNLFG